MKAIKIDDSGSVLVKAKNGIEVWVDVWEQDGELTADWNKYIFYPQDVKIKEFQESCDNFIEATEIAIEYHINNFKNI
jgi:hypothetical protein